MIFEMSIEDKTNIYHWGDERENYKFSDWAFSVFTKCSKNISDVCRFFFFTRKFFVRQAERGEKIANHLNESYSFA